MLTIKELMTWIQSTEVGMTISQSRGWFPALEMIHVTATTFVFGMITIVDLRLLGVLARGSAVRDLYRDVIPLTWAAFVVAAVTATTFVFGMITIVDLRLLGLLARGSAVRDLYRDVIPLTWAAFVVAAFTGILLFTGQAVAYSVNFAFQLKFAVLALIGLNMLAFRWFVYPGIADWDRTAAIPRRARLAGAISLAGWIAVVSCARWIAYLMI